MGIQEAPTCKNNGRNKKINRCINKNINWTVPLQRMEVKYW